jgi:hypothetical protein
VTEHKDIALGAFLYMEGAFKRTSFDTVNLVSERHGLSPQYADEFVLCWIAAK